MERKQFEYYINLSKEEKAAAINSGVFNSYIEAYLIATLYAMNISKDKIKLSTGVLHSLLDDTPADAIIEVAKDLMKTHD